MNVPNQPALTLLRTRRLTVGEIFDAASSLFREQWRPIALVAVLINAPLAGLDYWATGNADPESLSGSFTSVVVELVSAMVAILSATAFTLIAAKAIEGHRPAVMTLIRESFGSWTALVLTALLGGVIVCLLLLCLVVPGIVWMIYYTFIMQSVVLRGLRLKAALDYSKSLVQGRWWRTGGVVFVTALPAVTLAIIMALPAALMPRSLPLRILMNFLGALATAFQYLAMTILFLNEEAVRRIDPLREPAWLRPVTAEPGETAGEAAGPAPGPIYP